MSQCVIDRQGRHSMRIGHRLGKVVNGVHCKQWNYFRMHLLFFVKNKIHVQMPITAPIKMSINLSIVGPIPQPTDGAIYQSNYGVGYQVALAPLPWCGARSIDHHPR
jgi:hypothetical protein